MFLNIDFFRVAFCEVCFFFVFFVKTFLGLFFSLTFVFWDFLFVFIKNFNVVSFLLIIVSSKTLFFLSLFYLNSCYTKTRFSKTMSWDCFLYRSILVIFVYFFRFLFSIKRRPEIQSEIVVRWRDFDKYWFEKLLMKLCDKKWKRFKWVFFFCILSIVV